MNEDPLEEYLQVTHNARPSLAVFFVELWVYWPSVILQIALVASVAWLRFPIFTALWAVATVVGFILLQVLAFGITASLVTLDGSQGLHR